MNHHRYLAAASLGHCALGQRIVFAYPCTAW